MSASASLSAGAAQREAIDYPLDGALLAITGVAGTGKSAALRARAERAQSEAPGAVLIANARFGLEAAALAVLVDRARETGAPEPEIVDDVRAATIFRSVATELFALEWVEFLDAEVDPEITGLRSPQYFADAAFQLIRRLRGGLLGPDDLRRFGLQGAAKFYAKPPNLADAGLIVGTKEEHRDSLRVGPSELNRQREREIDLVKILARLYQSYVDALVARGCMTSADAVFEATRVLRDDRAARERARARLRFAFVDDAQDLSGAQIGFLEALYGPELRGVTLAGDAAQDTRSFDGARGTQLMARAATTFELLVQYRCPPAVLRAADVARTGDKRSGPIAAAAAAVELYRGDSQIDEARYVAETSARLIAGGVAPERIAVIVRNLSCSHPYVGALLARNVPLDIAGAANLYDFPPVADALAALWALEDPYRHDWLLRNLEAPWLHLSDASIEALCGDAADPQELLFELPGEPADENRRWDRRRELRLARNVTRGDVDAELPDEARARIVAFRAAMERWERLERRLALPELIRTIAAETALPALGDDARGRFGRGLIERLIAQAEALVRRKPLATLGDFLAEAEDAQTASAALLRIAPLTSGCVTILDVEAAKGREFDHVFIVDARAGAFPAYYSPDTFLFTPGWGMIPKENVGDDARSQRTAKFSYIMHRLKLRERYVEQERQAFACAATRARERLYVSAWGRPTKGVAAPEILEELRAAGAGG